eukprot:1961437-Pyramimonas_sp.AAC.1
MASEDRAASARHHRCGSMWSPACFTSTSPMHRPRRRCTAGASPTHRRRSVDVSLVQRDIQEAST